MLRCSEVLTVVFLTSVDQAVKALTAGQAMMLIPSVIRINYTENRGFSLGMFSESGTPALVLSALVLVAVLLFLLRLQPSSRLRIPLTLVVAGALGNLIDRVFLGYVRDMFELLFIRFYIFNPADICITGGAALGIILTLLPGGKETA